jgi:hypothetical protein
MVCAACDSTEPAESSSGGSGGAGTAGSGGTAGSAGAAGASGEPSSPRVGYFDIKLVPPDPATDPPTEGLTSLVGKIYESPLADVFVENMLWEPSEEQEGCRLLEPRVPFCDPSCEFGETCVEDGQCAARPATVSVGTVTVQGLRTAEGATEFSMEPVGNNYQSPTLPYPAFAEGDPIRLESSGGDFQPFAIESTGISQLQTSSGGPLPMEREQPLALSWIAAGQPDLATIQIKVDIAHHGGARGKIVCETADTGSFSVPAPLVNRLMNLGIAGFPTAVLTRKAVGSTQMEHGRVELTALSTVELGIQIEGLVSCNEDADCPDGQTCQDDLKCM